MSYREIQQQQGLQVVKVRYAALGHAPCNQLYLLNAPRGLGRNLRAEERDGGGMVEVGGRGASWSDKGVCPRLTEQQLVLIRTASNREVDAQKGSRRTSLHPLLKQSS